ncbi:helix-turn-helix transcriptional regulator [Planktotalea arctica]|uniref:helix-turn-helix transcriptional regulator n=1 Tax=Planktotalea arctica TaxID=1481893 RepID=UPI00321B7AC2
MSYKSPIQIEQAPVAIDQLIRDREGAALLGCSKATWWRRVADGTLPKPIKIGGLSRWKLSDVAALVDEAACARSDKGGAL